MYVWVYIHWDLVLWQGYGEVLWMIVVGRCDTYAGIVLIVTLRGYEDRNQMWGLRLWKVVLIKSIKVVTRIWNCRVSIAWHWYIYVPSSDDNCRLADRQLFVLILFGLIRPGIIGRLIERKWPTVVWHWRVQPFPFCNGNRIGVLSLEIARERSLPPHRREGHSVKSYSEVGCWNECLQDGTMYL